MSCVLISIKIYNNCLYSIVATFTEQIKFLISYIGYPIINFFISYKEESPFRSTQSIKVG